jgi:outer membrane protein OmpA-like peptidoglycan-associated protein
VWKEVHPHYRRSESKEPEEHPGYTIWSLSTAVYRQLRAEGSAPISILTSESPVGVGAPLAGLGFGGAREVPVRWKGTLTRVSTAPESFPLLVDGRRVSVPALHLRGQFTARERAWAPEIWVLADSAHPLLLKWIGAFQHEENVLQTVRVEHPAAAAAALERDLVASCRAELPGVYFGFNSAALDPASERTITSLADVLARHADWKVTIEGHTDSIGSVAANQALSERRVEAVRQRLVTGYHVDAGRLRVVGYGRSRPRESNATIEGRARNRRVELVRDCAGQNRSR